MAKKNYHLAKNSPPISAGMKIVIHSQSGIKSPDQGIISYCVIDYFEGKESISVAYSSGQEEHTPLTPMPSPEPVSKKHISQRKSQRKSTHLSLAERIDVRWRGKFDYDYLAQQSESKSYE